MIRFLSIIALVLGATQLFAQNVEGWWQLDSTIYTDGLVNTHPGTVTGYHFTQDSVRKFQDGVHMKFQPYELNGDTLVIYIEEGNTEYHIIEQLGETLVWRESDSSMRYFSELVETVDFSLEDLDVEEGDQRDLIWGAWHLTEMLYNSEPEMDSDPIYLFFGRNNMLYALERRDGQMDVENDVLRIQFLSENRFKIYLDPDSGEGFFTCTIEQLSSSQLSFRMNMELMGESEQVLVRAERAENQAFFERRIQEFETRNE